MNLRVGGIFRIQHRQGCPALFLMILVVVGCHWTAFKHMAFEVCLVRAIFSANHPIIDASILLPMLKASFSLNRSPKTLHLFNPVDPCGFSGQVKADDLSSHLMVYAICKSGQRHNASSAHHLEFGCHKDPSILPVPVHFQNL